MPCYCMIWESMRLYATEWYAIRFEQKCHHREQSSKHSEVKW